MGTKRRIAHSRSHDQDASDRDDLFADFFRAHVAGVERYVQVHLSRDAASVEDVCAEVFVTALNRFERDRLWEQPTSVARAWLLKVAWHKCLHEYRSGYRQRRAAERFAEVVDAVPPEMVEDRVLDHLGDDGQVAAQARQVLSELDSKHRTVLELDLFGPLSGRELAMSLGVSHVAARLRLMRARRAFAEHWVRRFGSPWTSEEVGA